MNLKINDWSFDVKDDFIKRIKKEYAEKNMLPNYEDIFKAYELTKLKNVKIVILGQDPYPNKEDAMGLAFSVNKNSQIPASLKNMFKELKNDLNVERANGDLSDWAEQGILLLNTTLIVEANNSNSHKNFGFDTMIKQTILQLNNISDNVIYLLLGKNSQQYESLIKSKYIIKEPHPSPLSAYRGFFGSKIYSRINEILKKEHKEIIDWS